MHSYINKQAVGYILVGSLTRLKTSEYKINGAEYIKVDIKRNGELNPGVIPLTTLPQCNFSLEIPEILKLLYAIHRQNTQTRLVSVSCIAYSKMSPINRHKVHDVTTSPWGRK